MFQVSFIIAATIAIGFSCWRLFYRTRFFVHVLQLQGYKPNEYFKWLRRRGRDILVRLSHVLAAILLTTFWLSTSEQYAKWPLVALLVAWAICFASSRAYTRTREKKSLAYTPRLNRLFALVALVLVAILLTGILTWYNVGNRDGVTYVLLGLLLSDLLAPVLVGLASIATKPFERYVHATYKKKAKKKLASMPKLGIVGITGSYGKTSTKFAIAEILGQRLNVLATPGSYNTPMGLCLVINRDLKHEHSVLIAEMGARYAGDIAELCDLVQPAVGVITNVGYAHVASMGSIDNIEKEKGTLAERIGKDGFLVLNADDQRVDRMDARTQAHVLRVGIQNIEKADFWATNISYDSEGAHFDVHSRSEQTVRFDTALLGAHNIMNILLAVAVGSTYDMRLRQMAHAVQRLKPIEHRLSLRRNGAYLVLDDAFNSNPIGARNAVEVLGSFTSDQRIVITPGMIELGDLHQELNYAFGQQIAGNADYVLLVGKNQTRPIQEGLSDAGFPDERLTIHRSLWDAQEHLKTFVASGAVVLYENDLPDQFEERS